VVFREFANEAFHGGTAVAAEGRIAPAPFNGHGRGVEGSPVCRHDVEAGNDLVMDPRFFVLCLIGSQPVPRLRYVCNQNG
jgi:hypothetical protein